VNGRFLSLDERIVIADLLRAVLGVRAIATELGRPPSMISREIEPNRHPGSGAYRPHAAQDWSDKRRPRPKIAATPELREWVQGMPDDRSVPSRSAAGRAAIIPTGRSCM